MHYQQDWTRPKKIEDADMEADYYNKYSPFGGVWKGQHFFGKVIYAYTTISSFKNKSTGKPMQCEVLHLIILIKNSPEYVQVDIWGSKRSFDEDAQVWSEWGTNPVRLQDFLYLAKRFKQGVDIEENYQYSTPYEDRTVYPHLCGVELSVLAGKVGEREYKGKFYDTNEFILFDVSGHSAQELQLKIKELDDIHRDLKELKDKYAEFTGKLEDEEQAEMADTQAQRLAVQEAHKLASLDGVIEASPVDVATEPFNPNNDDLPF